MDDKIRSRMQEKTAQTRYDIEICAVRVPRSAVPAAVEHGLHIVMAKAAILKAKSLKLCAIILHIWYVFPNKPEVEKILIINFYLFSTKSVRVPGEVR